MSDLVRELRAKAQQSTRTDKRWDDHVAWRGADEIERLSAENAELLEALRPIAHIARNVVPKTQSRRDDDGYEIVVTVGNLRRIHSAYTEAEGTE